MKLVIIAVLALIASPALAAPKAAKPKATSEDVWSLVKSANANDLKYAAKIAKQANTPRSNVRAACYVAWLTALEQKDRFGLQNLDGSPSAMVKPYGSKVTSFEELQQAKDHLDPAGFLMAACAPAAALVKMTPQTFFKAFVSTK